MKAIDRLYDYLAEKSLKPTTVEKEWGFQTAILVLKKREEQISEKA